MTRYPPRKRPPVVPTALALALACVMAPPTAQAAVLLAKWQPRAASYKAKRKAALDKLTAAFSGTRIHDGSISAIARPPLDAIAADLRELKADAKRDTALSALATWYRTEQKQWNHIQRACTAMLLLHNAMIAEGGAISTEIYHVQAKRKKYKIMGQAIAAALKLVNSCLHAADLVTRRQIEDAWAAFKGQEPMLLLLDSELRQADEDVERRKHQLDGLRYRPRTAKEVDKPIGLLGWEDSALYLGYEKKWDAGLKRACRYYDSELAEWRSETSLLIAFIAMFPTLEKMHKAQGGLETGYDEIKTRFLDWRKERAAKAESKLLAKLEALEEKEKEEAEARRKKQAEIRSQQEQWRKDVEAAQRESAQRLAAENEARRQAAARKREE